MVVRDVDDAVPVEPSHPRPVVQDSGDDVARGPVALKLQHVQVALAVDREQVDELAVRGADLPTDH